MAGGPHRIGAATGGSSWTFLVAVVVLSSAFAVPTLLHGSSTSGTPRLASPDSALKVSEPVQASSPQTVPSSRSTAPAFSAGSVGEVARTSFPGFNTSLPGSFTSSVATWLVGTPAYVPTTNTLWFPQRAIPVAGDPIPSVAPAAVFSLTTGEFDLLDTNLSNASALVYDPGNGDLYAAEPTTDSVVALNPATGSMIGSPIPVGISPAALALDPNSNELFVANSGSSNVTIIDTLTATVSVSGVSTGSDPTSLAYDPRDALVFVANSGSKWITVINATDPSVSLPEIKLVYGAAVAVSYSAQTDTVAAAVPSSIYATVIGASVQAAITQVATVGIGVASTVASSDGTSFVFGNSTGGNLVVLNSTTGVTVDANIAVAHNASDLAVVPSTGLVYCWGTQNRVLQAVNLTTAATEALTSTDSPHLSALSYSPGSQPVYGVSQNDSLIYSLGPDSVTWVSRPLQSVSSPLSVASDPIAGRFFIGSSAGLTVYNSSSEKPTSTVSGLSGNCTQLVLDRPSNLIWLYNSISGVVAVNLTTLHVAISTGLVISPRAIQAIAVDPSDSEVFVLVSSSLVTVLNSATGDIITSDLTIGTNVTNVVFDPADDQVYAAGDTVNFIDGATLVVDGGVSPFGGAHRVLAEAYDPSREAVLVTSVGLLSNKQGTVTAIDGASVASSEGSTVDIPVGEEPAAIAVVPPQGVGGAGLATIWVANELSGTISVISTPPEVSYFAATPATVDLGQPVSIRVVFSGGAGNVNITYQGLPDGCVSTDSSELNCTPTAPGEFHLVVNLTDSLGDLASANATLSVMKTLAVKVSLSPTTLPEVDVGVPVVGTASALDGLAPYNYSWSFGDGTVVSGPNASHSYSTPGDYSILAGVRDATGATAESTDVVIVVPRPTVGIVLNPGNATDVDFPVELSTTVTGGTGTVGVSWSFGDGTEATGANATHAWTRPGAYSVAVESVDALGVASNATVTVTVHPSLAATFSVGNGSSGSTPVVGSQVSFTSDASGGTPPYSVSWMFGDGSMASGTAVEHSYGAAGTYRVAVVLTDTVGALVRANLTVVVSGTSVSAGAISAPGGGFATGLFLGLVLGGVVAAVVLFAAGPRKRDRTPSTPPSPYVPP